MQTSFRSRALGASAAVVSLLVAFEAVAGDSQVVLPAAKDNSLIQDPAGQLSGGGEDFFVGHTAQPSNGIRRGLIAFDFSSIPVGSTITGVSLRLRMDRNLLGTSTPISLHAVLEDWGEGTAVGLGGGGTGGQAGVGDATWLFSQYDTNAWTNPGGDFVAAASATTSVGGVGFYTWSGPGLVADVQRWLDDPSSNFGWLLLGDESNLRSAKRFVSREGAVAANRPELTVTYVIPAPGAGVLAAAGLLAAGRRRR